MCPRCYQLLPSKYGMIVRDTEKAEYFEFEGEEYYLLVGDILTVYHGRCI